MDYAKTYKKQTQKCFVALVRHGERADQAPLSKTSKPYLIKHDPPLTDKGIQQALETGKALKKFLHSDLKVDEVVLECSPFIRTMMTAAGIAKELGLPKIHINYLYSEFMSDRLYQKNPFENTIISTKD